MGFERMAYDLWTYESIKNMIVTQTISPHALDNLKCGFAGEIGSKRCMSHIKSLVDLLDVLERRDVINPANVGALEDICYFLRNKKLINAISLYKPEEKHDLINEYALERLQNEQERVRVEGRNSGRLRSSGIFEEDHRTPQKSNPVPLAICLSGKKRDKVYDLITTEIGKKWRDFGREIKIREGEMDNLEANYPRSPKTKVRKMLELFEEDERVDPKQMMSCICTGLINCRRADLSSKIQDILTR